MAFKRAQRSKTNIESPESLFGDLRSRKIEGLLSHQADMLRSYMNVVEKNNVAFEMPTGSGKTLVGLLIGEWRRQQKEERVVYLCPTRQLVNQVVSEAINKYGINVSGFTGSKDEYSPADKTAYKTGEAIAVTTYNSLFNINPFFDDANLIIMDDAHAAENYVGSYWSMLITRKEHHSIYFPLIEMFKEYVPMTLYEQLKSNDPVGFLTVDKIPTPDFIQLMPQIVPFLDEQVRNTKLNFPWSVLRNNLFASHVYLNWASILIRPIIPPTMTHKPFSNANQRLFMSATLGLGGDLERIIGLSSIERLPIQEGWRRHGLGRKFFFFPEMSLDQKEALALAIKLTESTTRALILVPDDRTATKIQGLVESDTKNKVFQPGDIEESKIIFTQHDNAVAILANRFDGIDLLGDECRLIILKDLPRAANLQEQFLESRMAASVILKDRIRTRTVQAIGRCTRSANDYSAVCVLGQELQDQLIRTDNQKLYHPELQAEIKFGIEQPKNAEDSDFIENLQIFLDHGPEWNDVEKDIVDLREKCIQDDLPDYKKLYEAVKFEVYYQYDLWEKNFAGALENAFKVIQLLDGIELKGYRGFWYYLAANAAWLEYLEGRKEYEDKAVQCYKEASKCTSSLPWFRRLARLNQSVNIYNQPADPYLPYMIDQLEIQIEGMGVSNQKFEKKVSEILANLANPEATQFELGHVELGRLLGYFAENSTSDSAPDPWWVVDEKICIVFEDKSKGDSPISVNKTRQVESHPMWIKDRVKLADNAKIIPIMITTGKTIDINAIPIATNSLYWHIDDFRQWAETAINAVRKLKNSFSGIGNMFWRSEAERLIKEAMFDPESIISNLKLLKSVPPANKN